MANGSGQTAYNPSDPTQSAFLSALALGESGGSPDAYSVGVGGHSLSGASVDQYGFPQWQGQGNSHAAGAFQFEPGTWDAIAAQYGLNFSNPADQNAGAWYLAEQTYSNATGGQSLETALQNKDYTGIQNALRSVWPSVTGNGAAPQGLANDLAQGTGAAINPGAASADTSGSGSSGSASSQGGILGDIENWFIRGGLIIIGGIVVALALWALLAKEGTLPGPKQLAKAVAV